MEFEVRSSLGKRDFTALDRVTCRTYRRWSAPAVRTLMILLGVWTEALCLLLVIGGGLSQGLGAFTLVSFLLGLLPLSYGLAYHQLRGIRRRLMAAQNGPAVLTFGGTALTAASACGTASQSYDGLDRLRAYRGSFYLFLDRNHCFVVPMDGFTKGASADFARFIQEKSGKPLAPISGRATRPMAEPPAPRAAPVIAAPEEAAQPEEIVRHRFDLPEGYAFGDLVALNRAAFRVNRQWGELILRLLLCGFGLVQIAAGLALLRTEALTPENGSALVFPVVLGTLLLLLGLGRTWLSALASRRLLSKNVGPIAVTLTNRSFREETRKGSARYPYASFTAIARSGGDYLLFLDKRHAFILPERSRSGGDPEAFQGFLEEKTGLPVRILKKRPRARRVPSLK